MIRRAAQWLLVLALSFSIGLQWALLQSAAWVGMVISYSHEATLMQSLAMTFDGKHPCRLCRTVQEGGTAQKKQELCHVVTKVELAAQQAEIFTCACCITGDVVPFEVPLEGIWRLAPPKPPPKCGVAALDVPQPA